MSYYSDDELNDLGFKSFGKNVKISTRSSIYDPNLIVIGNNVRIDDFCVISGNINFGDYIHVTPMCLIAGGESGIFFDDFVTLAYGVKIFAQSDDYSGRTMCNSLIPKKYKDEIILPIYIKKHVILGTNSCVMPGVTIAEGTSVGAMSLLTQNTEPWSIYVGTPAIKIKDRKRNLLSLANQFIGEINE